jgi:hypothetical protein
MLSGNIEEFGVHNTVQLAELMSATGRLSLKTNDAEYSLFYDQGVLVHAEAGAKRGDEAVVYVLRRAQSGHFELDQNTQASERTVTKAIQLLVLLAAKEQDEEKAIVEPPPRDTLGEKLDALVTSLHLRFATYVTESGQPTVRINPESPEPIDMQLLCSMTNSYLSQVEVERILGTTKTYQFAIGRAGPGWLFLGGGTDIPLAMLGSMLRKAIAQLQGEADAPVAGADREHDGHKH